MNTPQAATSRPLGELKLSELRAEAHRLGRGGRYRSRADAIAAIKAAKRQAARVKPSGPGTIREKAEEILRRPIPYSEALAEVKRAFPGANTSLSSMRWYQTQMKKRGEELPARPIDYPGQRAA